MRTTRPHPDPEAVSRRLALLGEELAGVRPAVPEAPPEAPEPAWWADHTRVAAGREPPPGPPPSPHSPSPTSPPTSPPTSSRTSPAASPAASPPATAVPVPVPGRHASRRSVRRPTLAAPHLAVVALAVAAALAVTCWWLVRGDADPARELQAAPAAGLVTPAAQPVADTTSDRPSDAASDAASGAATAPATVTVDVAGRVRHPGIAVLAAGARVVDALQAAGGARDGVDLTDLNLARVLVDGEQIVVGLPPPDGVAAASAAAGPAPVGGTSGAPGALVDLNTADATELDGLPEVGPVTAAAILDWRSEHGGFTSVDELLEVDGIGEATLGKIAPYVTV